VTPEREPTRPDGLSAELERLVQSVTAVEELSRQARAAAVGDLAQYEALVESAQQYNRGLEQASAIYEQATQAFDRAFGHSAKRAAESPVSEAKQVRDAFGQLVEAWQHRADDFLGAHPDVELLVAERRVQEEHARQQELLSARMRRRGGIVAALNSALDAQ